MPHCDHLGNLNDSHSPDVVPYFLFEQFPCVSHVTRAAFGQVLANQES